MISSEFATIDNLFLQDIKSIIATGRQKSYDSVNATMIQTYWLIGQRIVEEEQKGMNRAEYGKHIIDLLSKQLSSEFGPGFSSRYLRSFRQFYLIVPNYEIWKSRFPNLQWTHIFRSLRVSDPVAVRWYLETASNEMWSVRTLSRNIGTQYYERHFKQPLLPSEQNDTDGNNAAEIIKSPIIAEFLGFKQDESFSEEDGGRYPHYRHTALFRNRSKYCKILSTQR